MMTGSCLGGLSSSAHSVGRSGVGDRCMLGSSLALVP